MDIPPLIIYPGDNFLFSSGGASAKKISGKSPTDMNIASIRTNTVTSKKKEQKIVFKEHTNHNNFSCFDNLLCTERKKFCYPFFSSLSAHIRLLQMVFMTNGPEKRRAYIFFRSSRQHSLVWSRYYLVAREPIPLEKMEEVCRKKWYFRFSTLVY